MSNVKKPETKLGKALEAGDYVMDCLAAYQAICNSGCCNDCDISRTCEYKPELGTLVRYNCPFYKKKDTTSHKKKEVTSQMKVSLISATHIPGLVCGEAAAVCTKSKNAMSALHHAVDSGHTSVLEHASFTFRIEGISRVTLAQLTRHRIASFSVESQRYVKMVDPDVIVPDSIKASKYADEAAELIERSVELYNKLTGVEVPCEDARYLLPMGSPTSLIMTMNARELLHFFSLRCCNRAQWEIRELADMMVSICLDQWPDIFKYAGPGCAHGKCPEKKPCGHPRTDWQHTVVKDWTDN